MLQGFEGFSFFLSNMLFSVYRSSVDVFYNSNNVANMMVPPDVIIHSP